MSAASAASSASPRRPAVEWLRVVAAFGVVWYHCGIEGSRIAYAGLIAFLVLSGFFWGLHFPQRSFQWSLRARRLLLPWLLWSAFYGFVSLFRSHGLTTFPNGWLATLLIGPVIHLWYLPFVFIATVLLDAASGPVGVMTRVGLTYFAALGLLLSSRLWDDAALGMGPPVAQYLFALVPTLFGAAVGLLANAGRRWLAAAAASTLIVVAASCAMQAGAGLDWAYPVGMAAAAGCLALPGRWVPSWPIDGLARSALGIYLLHPFFLLYLHKYHWLSGPAMAIATFLASLLTILCLRRLFPRLSAWAT